MDIWLEYTFGGAAVGAVLPYVMRTKGAVTS